VGELRREPRRRRIELPHRRIELPRCRIQASTIESSFDATEIKPCECRRSWASLEEPRAGSSSRCGGGGGQEQELSSDHPWSSPTSPPPRAPTPSNSNYAPPPHRRRSLAAAVGGARVDACFDGGDEATTDKTMGGVAGRDRRGRSWGRQRPVVRSQGGLRGERKQVRRLVQACTIGNAHSIRFRECKLGAFFCIVQACIRLYAGYQTAMGCIL
jgi:hypothetical protein